MPSEMWLVAALMLLVIGVRWSLGNTSREDIQEAADIPFADEEQALKTQTREALHLQGECDCTQCRKKQDSQLTA